MNRRSYWDSDPAGPLHVRVFRDASDIGAAAAREITQLVQERADSGRRCVLGLAAGANPVAVYRMLLRLHRQGLSFANLVTFNPEGTIRCRRLLSTSTLDSCEKSFSITRIWLQPVFTGSMDR